MLKDLSGYVSKEPIINEPAFISVPQQSAEPIPPPDEIVVFQDANEIRKVLNSHALAILSSQDENKYEQYYEFCRNYAEAINRAWFVSTEIPKNRLFEYSLERFVTKGGFGNIFEAIAPDDEKVAIKILRQDIHENPELLQSFRRGVNSMRILAENKIQGMVEYKAASEIPAYVVMDWVEGPNLQDAVLSKQVDDWSVKVRISKEICDIIRRAHIVPEHVLHRDIRPQNIMLKDFYSSEDWEVVVLDFDLSWHKGAIEESISYGMSSYLAPEQLVSIPGISTRHASVDSFGVGMTLYFILTGSTPRQNLHTVADWKERLSKAAKYRRCESWESLPNRFVRLISNATKDEQHLRWDMSQIQQEITLLHEALTTPSEVSSSELITEELAVRTQVIGEYAWNENDRSIVKEFANGLTLTLFGNETNQDVEIKLLWEYGGQGNWQHTYSSMQQKITSAVDQLTSAGWRVDLGLGQRSFEINGKLYSKRALQQIDNASTSLARVITLLMNLR